MDAAVKLLLSIARYADPVRNSIKLLFTLFVLLVPSAFAQTIYVGATTGTPIFNEDFKLGVQAGANLTPEFEVRVAAEGNLRNLQPNMASLDALYNFFLNVDRLTSGGDAIVGSPTNNALYLGAGFDGYYGHSARAINDAHRFGAHAVVGGEAMLGRFGFFGEVQPGFTFPPDWDDLEPAIRARLGINFHL